MGKIKTERLQERIKEICASILLRELNDPRLTFVTVTSVKLTEDLHYATIRYSTLEEGAKRRNVERALEQARGRIQSLIAGRLTTRTTPVISLEFDPSIERSVRMSHLIDEAVASDRAGRPPAAEE